MISWYRWSKHTDIRRKYQPDHPALVLYPNYPLIFPRYSLFLSLLAFSFKSNIHRSVLQLTVDPLGVHSNLPFSRPISLISPNRLLRIRRNLPNLSSIVIPKRPDLA